MDGEDGFSYRVSWLDAMCDVQRKARLLDVDPVIKADGRLIRPTMISTIEGFRPTLDYRGGAPNHTQ